MRRHGHRHRGYGRPTFPCGRPLLEPFQERGVLARRPLLHGQRDHLLRLDDVTRARERMGVGRGDFAAPGRRRVGVLEPRDRLAGPAERDVEQMTKVVRVPRVRRRALQRRVICAHRESVVPKERLAEPEHRPSAIVVGAMRQDTPRGQRRAPRVALDEKLGEVPMSEDALVASRLRRSRKAVEQREHFRRIDGAPQRPLDVLTKLPRFPLMRVHRGYGLAA